MKPSLYIELNKAIPNGRWHFDEILDDLTEYEDVHHFVYSLICAKKDMFTWPITTTKWNLAKGTFRKKSQPTEMAFWKAVPRLDYDYSKTQQYNLLVTMCMLREFSYNLDRLKRGFRRTSGPNVFFKFFTAEELDKYYKCSVETPLERFKKYPKEVKEVAQKMIKEELLSEFDFTMLGELLDVDYGLSKEAEHFRDPECLHSYGCKMLWQILLSV